MVTCEMFRMLGLVSTKAWPSYMLREVKSLAFGRLGRGGLTIKIRLCVIGFGKNSFFETLW